jgi:hypothetical protein
MVFGEANSTPIGLKACVDVSGGAFGSGGCANRRVIASNWFWIWCW